MKRTLIRNVRIFDPGAGIDSLEQGVLIEGHKIRDLDSGPMTAADEVIEGQGRFLCPGFIDLRAHLGEPGFSREETIESGLKAAAAGGYTSVVSMPTTEPCTDQVEVVEYILQKAEDVGGPTVLPAGCLSVGCKGEQLAEMGKLTAAGCVLFTDGNRAVKDSQLLRYAMETAYDLRIPIATHAEDESLSLGGVMNEGEVSTRLGLRGAPSAAEAVGVARDIAIAELTEGRLHLQHISTAGAVELIRQAKRRGVRVTAEVSPHHLLLTDEAALGYDTAAKVTPPLRTQQDLDAVIRALADGTIDAVASDHRGRTELDKNVEFDRAAYGTIALETAFAVTMELVGQGKLTLQRAVAVLTRGPAFTLGLKHIGRLFEGGPADLVLFDPEESWMYEARNGASRSVNTAFDRRRFKGRVCLTMAKGEVCFAA